MAFWDDIKNAASGSLQDVIKAGGKKIIADHLDTPASTGEYSEGRRLGGNAEWHAPQLPTSGNVGAAAQTPAAQTVQPFLSSDNGKLAIIGGAVALVLLVVLLK